MTKANGFSIDKHNIIHLYNDSGVLYCGASVEAGNSLNTPDPNVNSGHVLSCETCLRLSRKATASVSGTAEVLSDEELEEFDV